MLITGLQPGAREGCERGAGLLAGGGLGEGGASAQLHRRRRVFSNHAGVGRAKLLK